MDQEKEKAIENTRRWVQSQPWYRNRGERLYIPSAEAIRNHEEKYKVKYQGVKPQEENEEPAAKEKPEMEDPELEF